MARTIEEINQLIARGEATILTAREIEDLLTEGREREAREVDVVTTGTMGLMSGTYALLSFPITEAGRYRRFTEGTMNGVPMNIGPCPNESLGILDVMIYGTARSKEDPDYGGGFLFRDLVEGKEVDVVAFSEDGREVRTSLTLDAMPFAKLMGSRSAFRNYRAFVNPSSQEVRSIFHCRPFPPNYGGLTFSGCGHLNPLQNDPGLRTIGLGTRLLFNGGEGFVIGAGTRSSPKHPNLMTMADMRGMDPTLMGGLITSEGPECIASYALAIPIIDDSMLRNVLSMDGDTPLPIADVRDRSVIGEISYADVWVQSGEAVSAGEGICAQCNECSAARSCPTRAISRSSEGPRVDRTRCYNCGNCVIACEQGCYEANLGTVEAVLGGEMRHIPILGRFSNREGALRTMADLKSRIMEGSFTLTSSSADIRP